MHGLPKGIDLSFFRGKDLQQVAVGPFCVQLHFHQNVSIYVLNQLEHISQGNIREWDADEKQPTSAASLLSLIGASVVSAEGTEDGTLTLQFSNSDTVRIFDREDYEAYHIYNNDQEITV